MGRCREGASITELAEALERKERAVLLRAKRLLPLDQRGVPEDRITAHLHRVLTEDDDYDWEHHLAATPPPRPVVNHLPAPEVRRGIPGLEDEELLAIAGLVIRLGEATGTVDLRDDLAREIERRDLGDRLESNLARDARRWLANFRDTGYYRVDTSEWYGPESDPFSPGPHPDHEW
ncbi:hypothetical protein MWU75_11835 [Ornithinimicrobium sp. F0845]|uniref:hypothetical protein n=1 Tax=Ornithinimicrobium sp. F0845 TaxID=2926412 RepID=UPI001FF224BD|nr:hypothetical protein [Ornithinimicrobium sp. F0845]MCK0112831.1 hypothetical protein [Ornithinimicrobium sp. F0845]